MWRSALILYQDQYNDLGGDTYLPLRSHFREVELDKSVVEIFLATKRQFKCTLRPSLSYVSTM